MTPLPTPVYATAANKDSSGAQQTAYQALSAALTLVVHVLTHATALAPLVRVRAFSAPIFTPLILPSPEGIRRDVYWVFVPMYRFFWRVGAIGVMPRAEVITRLPAPVLATATNKDNSGAQHTDHH
jgi:hypothetical protein